MGEHELLVFLVDVLVLVLAARLGAEVAVRLGVPPVVGEILFGVFLGPTLLGRVWPQAFTWLFPADPTHTTLMDGLAWIGVLFLVAISGLETRLGLLRRSGRLVLLTWVGGFLLPFVAGLALGSTVPASMMGEGVDRPVFAFFLAIAMAISAIPVIARILLDLHAYGTRPAMVIMSSALADDTLGWVLLGIVSGIVGSGSISWGAVSWAAVGTVLFLVLAFWPGQMFVRSVLRSAVRMKVPHAQVSAVLSLILVGAILTQAIGVHMVLGAFVAAILIGRTRSVTPETGDALRRIGFGFFIPFFFAYTGSKADLGALRGSVLVVTVIAIVLACLTKVVGGGLGARLGGLPRWEAASVGVGLTARGAMELVIAAIGLSLGVLSTSAYAMLVVIAMITSMIAGPALRLCLIRAGLLDRTPAVIAGPVLDLAGPASSRTLADRSRGVIEDAP